MTSNQIAKQQADAATENAAANKSNARTNARNYRESVRHNKKEEALKTGEVVIKGVDTGGKLITNAVKGISDAAGKAVTAAGLLNDVD